MFTRNLVQELAKRMEYDLKSVYQVSKAWEENIRDHDLVNSKGPLISSRTKHIGIKDHWFRPKIIPTQIEILRMNRNQRATRRYVH